MTPFENKTDRAAPVSTPAPSPSRSRKILRWGEHVLAFIGLCYVVFHFTFEITAMTSESMSPTLLGTSYENGDRIMLEKITGWFRSPKRWEIHFFYNEEGTPVTKRIVGLPGERISVKKGRICVNGTEVALPKDLPHLKCLAAGTLGAGREVDCGKGYFVLGDDSKDSYDSRFTGPVGPERVRGRVFCIVWPLSRIGLVK